MCMFDIRKGDIETELNFWAIEKSHKEKKPLSHGGNMLWRMYKSTYADKDQEQGHRNCTQKQESRMTWALHYKAASE